MAIDHELLTLALVQPEKAQEALEAAILVLEHSPREMPIQELQTASDGTGFADLREVPMEGTEIDLQGPTLRGAIHQPFLELEEPFY
jgi:hypothetical protein